MNKRFLGGLNDEDCLSTNLKIFVPLDSIQQVFLISPGVLFTGTCHNHPGNERCVKTSERILKGHLQIPNEDVGPSDQELLRYAVIKLLELRFAAMPPVPVVFERSSPTSAKEALDIILWRVTQIPSTNGSNLEQTRRDLAHCLISFAESKKQRAGRLNSDDHSYPVLVQGRNLMALLALYVCKTKMEVQTDDWGLVVKVEDVSSLKQLFAAVCPADFEAFNPHVHSSKRNSTKASLRYAAEFDFTDSSTNGNANDGYVYLHGPFQFKWKMHSKDNKYDVGSYPSEGAAYLNVASWTMLTGSKCLVGTSRNNLCREH
jgi:hypothetical protein